MAREAAVRLTLGNGQFITSMKQAGDSVQSVATKGQKSMDAFGAAANNVRSKVLALGGAAKNVARYAASLGGAFTFGNAIKDALSLQTSYRHIAFGVKNARGEMLKAADVQKIVERSAALTGQANAKMADGFRDLLDASADVDFSTKVLAAVGTTAAATGDEISTLTTLADQLNSKFGITADQMLDVFAQVKSAAEKGGPKMSEFADVMGAVGAELNAAGLEGKAGLDFMLGALNATDQRFKSLPKQVAGLKAVLRGLGESGELTKLASKLGLDPTKLINEKVAIARLRRILGTGEKGAKALLGGMHQGEERETMNILFIEPFEKALAEAQKSGLKGQAAIDAAILVFDKGIAAMGKAGMDGAALQREADAARKSPEMQLTLALNRLSNAFSKPAIIAAIDQLAQSLPKLAEHIASFIEFAAKHPYLTGAGAIGGNLLGGVVTEALGGALAAGGGALVKKMIGKKGGAGLAGATVEAASGIQRYHQFGMAGGITGQMLGAAPEALAAGEAAAAGIAPALGAGLALTIAGAVTAAVAAAGLGYGIYKLGNEEDASRELASATAGAYGGGSRSGKEAALERLTKAKTSLEEADVGGGPLDMFARLFTDVDSRKGAAEQMKLAGEAIAKLQADLGRPAAMPGAPPGKATTGEVDIVGRVKVDAESSRLIAAATTTALGGRILDVRITNARDIGVPNGGGPVIGRGPMKAGETRQGGGV